MLDVIKLMTKVVFAPVWLAWKGYLSLWWAFEGMGMAPTPVVTRREPERGSSFEVTDSRPKPPALPAPLGLLKGGFIGTLLFSGFFALVSVALSGQPMWQDRAFALWGCLTGFTAVGSIFAVRRVAFARAQRKTWQQRVRDAAKQGAKRAADGAQYVASQAANAGSRIRQAGSNFRESNAQPVSATHSVNETPPDNHSSTTNTDGNKRAWKGTVSNAGASAWRIGRGCVVEGAKVCGRMGRAAGIGARHAVEAYRQAGKPNV